VNAAQDNRHVVVVADDDADIRGLVAVQLETVGYEVHVAEDGEAALALALELRPSVCVLDVRMPGLSGYEVTRALRTRLGDAVRVLLLSASVERDKIHEGLEAGADAYMEKPFSAKELRDRVRELLGNREAA
jgi:DNA-binding response OmpR family regulator